MAGHTVFAVSKNDLILMQSIFPDFAPEQGFNVLSIIGTGVGLGSKSAEKFLKIFKNLKIKIEYLFSGEKFLKAVVPESMADTVHHAVHQEFFEAI